MTSRITGKQLLLLCVGWLTLSATTPGAVGSCGSDELSEPAGFRDYCEKREELVCVRRFKRKEITEETTNICRWDAADACARRSFPAECSPTRRETEACLRALASLDTLDTPEENLAECSQKALCKATPSEQMPAAGSGGSGGNEENSR